MKKRALISVSDKNGIEEFAKNLHRLGYEIISTGSTAKKIREAGVPAIEMGEVTGFPECLDGRVKTLHPKVHGGLLAVRDNKEHMETLKKFDINTIDIVAVNLYPFKATIEKEHTLAEAVENIDIGGPAMIRSAAKNHKFVTVLTDPADYAPVIKEIEEKGDTCPDTRFFLMYKAFAHTAKYDTLISNYFAGVQNIDFPRDIAFAYTEQQPLRYGENPHQKAIFYRDERTVAGGIPEAEQLHGKELSYNNILDVSSALELLNEFDTTAVVAVKHNNACGVSLGKTVFEAYTKAYECDPKSIFGGVIAVNDIVDEKSAAEMNKIFLEIVIAKDFSKEALAILTQKKNIRLLRFPNICKKLPVKKQIRQVLGGLLMQEKDNTVYSKENLKTATKKAPTKTQMSDMEFAYKVCKHIKSNAIVLVKDGKTVGIGIGQVNRIWALEQAIDHAGAERAAGSVMASDAYFPFPDCCEAAAKAGITAIIQPGGSQNDQASIDECDKSGIAMVFTGERHFKH